MFTTESIENVPPDWSAWASKKNGPTVALERGVYYQRRAAVSWFEALPAVSLELMEAAGLTQDTCVLDVGGGGSRLVDALVARGLECLAVLDISRAALHRAQQRLGALATIPTWIEADVAGDWSLKPMDIWHDRAVFHFLTDPADRARYVDRLHETLKPGGTAIVATFALDGRAVQRASRRPLRSRYAVGHARP